MEPAEPGGRIQQEIRVLGLKREVEEITDGQMTVSEAPDVEPEIAEAHWTQIRDYEKAPYTTHLEILTREGFNVRAPEEIPDEQIHEALWELIRHLAEIGVFLEHTDHLSDRHLYEHLYRESLREEVKAMRRNPAFAWHIGPIGSGSEEDMLIYHRYFASEKERRWWKKQWPDYQMPPREKKPYDRDRFLPQQEIPEMRIPGGDELN